MQVPYVGLNFAVYESLKDWLLQKNPMGLENDNELHLDVLGVEMRISD
jgi:solute carrier family 25 (mitochondrial phosphate transporter), member 23/24/25/41